MKTVPEMMAVIARKNAQGTAVVDHEREVTYRELLQRAHALSVEFQRLGIHTGDRVALLLPNGVDFVLGYLAISGAGGIVVPLNDQYQEVELLYFLEECQLSLLITCGEHETLCREVLAKTRFGCRPDFSSLRLCISASAPMPEKVNREFFDNFGIYVRQLYGSTETGTISVNLTHNVGKSLGSVGTPIHGVEVSVRGDDGRPVRQGQLGEFAVRSPGAIKAYAAVEGNGQEVFRDGWFFTGDLGWRDSNGLLYLAGRKKFFINRGGYKINPQEIEDLLENHPKIEEVVVIGVVTAFEDEKVKAVVVPKEPCREEEVVHFCRGKIADFKIPSLVEFRESLPKTATGKIRRKLLL